MISLPFKMAVVLIVLASPLSAAQPEVSVKFQHAGQTRTAEGRIVIDSEEGGLLLLGRDGRMWSLSIPGSDPIPRQQTGRDFSPFSQDELADQLTAELGPGFEITRTRHYVICSNTGTKYAEWCGSLFERLFAAFRLHWKRLGIPLEDPEFPLPAIVFATEQQFRNFSANDTGGQIGNAIGYYSITTNRMVMFDLTGEEGAPPARTTADILRKLAASPENVSTIIHEATHQIAYNTRLHRRMADNPLWLVEGMAMYFETPDLDSRTGWRTVGRVNRRRYIQFQEFTAHRRRADSLVTLLTSNDRLVNEQTASDAYAEAWALNYFLIKTRRKLYIDYLKKIAAKEPLQQDTAEERLKEFQETFGEDLSRLERDFLRYMQNPGR